MRLYSQTLLRCTEGIVPCSSAPRKNNCIQVKYSVVVNPPCIKSLQLLSRRTSRYGQVVTFGLSPLDVKTSKRLTKKELFKLVLEKHEMFTHKSARENKLHFSQLQGILC